jgi:predicted acylesterase/phospholipase RssA
MQCRSSQRTVRVRSRRLHDALRRSRLPVFVLVALSLSVFGCADLPRRPAPPMSAEDATLPGFQETVRYVADSQASYRMRSERVRARLHEAIGERPLNMLALSGGGAGGSFGAGVLLGWSRQGTRPEFDIVTGVSVGALYAPYAFLGSSWDDQLLQAFPRSRLEQLLHRSLLTTFFGASLYRGKPLHDLVDRFVTVELLQAVARESSKGRLLLVATTDLDKQAMVIWDLGAIARQGDDHARQLFRDVLIAAASIPGVFPPVMIQVQRAGFTFEEMHVDAATTNSFFVAPEAALFPMESVRWLHGENLYLIINGQLGAAHQTTQLGTLPVIKRGLDALAHSAMLSDFALTYGFAVRNEMNVHVAYIPDQYPYGGPLDFRYVDMRALFDYAEKCAASGELCTSPGDAAADATQVPLSAASDRPGCPAFGRGAIRTVDATP